MPRRPRPLTARAALLLLPATLALAACETPPAPAPGPGTAPGPGSGNSGNGNNATATTNGNNNTPGNPAVDFPTGPASPGVATAAVDAFDEALARGVSDGERLQLYGRRWLAVQRAIAQAGTDHEGAFYAGRGYWHTGYLRGGDWSWEHPRDLDEPVFVDGRGTVLIWGDADEDITVTGDAVVHILGDLNASVTLRGAGEVVVAGRISADASVLAGGTLDLYAGGGCIGTVRANGSCTAVIDGHLLGTLTAGQPATTVHVTGDCASAIVPPRDAAALLTLRVDGFMPDAAIRGTVDAGFTRVTASIATSDTTPGLYPAPGETQPSRSRWVVHRQAE